MSAGGSRYQDRFDASAYADDPPVGVFIDADDPDAVWVPERLFDRLVLVARAYALHLLPLLGGDEPVALNAAQVENLLDELSFISELLSDDPLVQEQVAGLRSYLRHVVAANANAVVTIEG